MTLVSNQIPCTRMQPRRDWRRTSVQRATDLVLLSLLAPVALVLLAAVVPLMRVLQGPGILFSQPRIGHRMQPFRIWKLRTMRHGAERELSGLLADNPDLQAEFAARGKLGTDPRITPVGAWLRRYRLDELPQIWNVARGDMRLVGPRPLTLAELNTAPRSLQQTMTLTRPGLTGLWQISDSNNADYDARLRLDRHYAQNAGLRLDLWIVWRTAVTVLRGRGE